MEDIFVSAKQGNRASVKGLYASSVSSAYTAVMQAVGDEQKAAEIIQEIYVSAFSEARSYDEFFLLLNKRASSACTFAAGSTVKIQSIAATHSAFSEPKDWGLPESLTGYENTLGGVVAQQAQNKAKHKISLPPLPFRKKKVPAKGDDLKNFEELVKKHAFSGFDDYVPEKEPEVEKAKSIAEKLQSEEIELSPEQLLLEKKEREKNRKTAIIAFVFSAIILAGAISTYFITKQMVSRRAQNTMTGDGVYTVASIDTVYNADEAYAAYRDYLNKVLIKQYGKASQKRIVAYNEAGDVGSAQLGGLVSYRILDIDGDGKEELAAIVSSVKSNQRNLYTYRFLLFLYRFNGKQVEAIQESYPLIEYRTYNRGEDYSLGNFNMLLREIQSGKKLYFYAEAASDDFKVSSFHYYENGKMFEAERFVSFRWSKSDIIFLQRRLDGTYEPLYLMLRSSFEADAQKISSLYSQTLAEYGFHLGDTQVRCRNKKEFTAYFNQAFKRIGLQLESWNISFDTEDTTDYLCYLQSESEPGDMLSSRTVVKITDYRELENFLAGGEPLLEIEEETTEEDTEPVVIPTTVPTTATTTTEEETEAVEQQEE